MNIEINIDEVKSSVTMMALISSFNHKSDLLVRVKSGGDMIPINEGFLKGTEIDPIDFGYFYSNTRLAGNPAGFGRDNKNDWRALNIFYIIDITGEEPNLKDLKKKDKNLYVIPYIEYESLRHFVREKLNCYSSFLVKSFIDYMNNSLKETIKKRDKSDTDQLYNIPFEAIQWVIDRAVWCTNQYNKQPSSSETIENLEKLFAEHCKRVAEEFEKNN